MPNEPLPIIRGTLDAVFIYNKSTGLKHQAVVNVDESQANVTSATLHGRNVVIISDFDYRELLTALKLLVDADDGLSPELDACRELLAKHEAAP